MCHNIQGSPPTRLAGNQIFFVFFNNIAVFPQKIFCGLWPRALCSLPGDTAAVGWLKGVGNGFSPHNGSQFDPMQSVPSPRLGFGLVCGLVTGLCLNLLASQEH